MVNVRSAVGVGMIWLAAVAGVSGTSWIAIDRAGRDITEGSVNSLSPLTVVNAPAATTPGTGATSTEATTQPSAKPERSEAPEPSATWKSPAAQATAPPPTSANVPPATKVRDGSFSATGGQVSARCTGDRIQLRIAQPDDGFRVQVESAGPVEIHVIFLHGDEDVGGETQVTAVCAAGAPAFKVVASDG